MAKEKTDATSLFSAMNKNRTKMTNIVKSIKNDEINDLNAQNIKKQVNTEENLDTYDEAKDSKEEKTTQMVNALFENSSNITKVIESENAKGEEVSDEIKGSEAKDETVKGRDDDESEVPEGAGDKEDPGEEKKDKELQHIHIALPKDVFDKLEIAKKAYYNNKTTYIRNLILDDYEKNKDYYDRLPNIR